MTTIKQIWFKHITGGQKYFPGITDPAITCPRVYHTSEIRQGAETPIMKLDPDHVSKITLLPEMDDVELTESEKKKPQRVQDRILERRSAEADVAIQANEITRRLLRHYESRGDIQVLDWEVEIDPKSSEGKKALISELSPIALADFADRGLEIPEHLQRAGHAISVAPKESQAEVVKTEHVPTKPKKVQAPG